MPQRATGHENEVERLADALHSAAIHLLRRLRAEDTATGLSPARLSALSVIVFAGPLRISDLAKAEQVRTPTITPIVAALEQDGLIVRKPDPQDARAAILTATAKGEKLMAAGRARRVAALAKPLRRLRAGDRAVLAKAAALLQRITRERVL